MRVIGLGLLLLLSCGEPAAEPARAAADAPWPIDGFLRLLPANPSIVARAPAPAAEGSDARIAVDAVLRLFGYADGDVLLHAAEGVDPDRAGGFATGADGSWLQFVPAADKGQLNAALRARAERLAVREEGDWIVLGTGGPPAPGSPEPLRAGDAALRVVHHGLLDEIAQPGDRLDLGITLLGGGLDASGHLTPGEASPTTDALARAGGPLAGNLDLLPAALAVRIETTLPPALFATALARRIARHASVPEGELRDNVERFLREAATGLDPATGIAIGFDLNKANSPGFVAVGRIAPGSPSPILARLRASRRETYGALVLDSRETKSTDLLGYFAWVPQAVPHAADLPDTLVPALGALIREDEGLLLTFTEAEGYGIVAAGARADVLAAAVRRRVLGGATQSSGARQLAVLRDRAKGECILAAVVAGDQFGGLVESDAGRLRSLLGAAAAAVAPELVVVGGFRADAGLAIEARVVYR